MSTDSSKSLTVIDATDAVVLAPEVSALVMDERQAEELEKCQHHLGRLGKLIVNREVDLVYLYVEAGWWLMRARETHRCCHGGNNGEGGRFTTVENAGERGFLKWLEQQERPIPQRTAYRWMQGAENAGLTTDSTILAIQTLREEKKLHGHTLGDICRKPVDKENRDAELHELSDEEQAAEEEAERIQRWETLAVQLHSYGIEADEWAKLDLERRAGLYDVLAELTKRIKPSLRKPKRVPALSTPRRKKS